MTSDPAPVPPRAELAAWLASPAATEVGRAADTVAAAHLGDPLAAAAALRRQHPGLQPDQSAALLEQAELRRRARAQYGIDDDVLLTRDGLEAATRPTVADRRARLVAAAGAGRVIDLTGGLGFDTAAFLRAGLAVTSVERDPETSAFLRHNCPGADIVEGDAADVLAALLPRLAPDDVVFVDPARRDPSAARDARTARARPERDPQLWSPPWSWVAAIPHPRVLAKVSPGFTPSPSWWAEWISVDRALVECTVASWPLLPADRRAAVLTSGTTHELAVRPDLAAETSEPQSWLHEPDPAVVRAGGLDTLAVTLGVRRLDAESTWLTGHAPVSSPLVRDFEVLGELTGSPRQQRRQLAGAGVRRVTVKSRDVAVDSHRVLRDLGVAEGPDAIVVLTRRTGRTIILLARAAGTPAR